MKTQSLAAAGALRAVAREWRRHWLRFGATAALVQAVSIIPLLAMSWIARGVFTAEAHLFMHGRYLTSGFTNVIGVEGILVTLGLSAFSVWLTLAAVMVQQNALLNAEKPSMFRGIRRGVRTTFRVLMVVLLVLAAVLSTTVVFTPLLYITRYLWPALIFAIAMYWRFPQIRSPWVRRALLAFIPLGIPLNILVRSALSLPSIVVGDHSIRGSLSDARARSTDQWLVIALALLASIISTLALEAALVWLPVHGMVALKAPALLVVSGSALIVMVTSFLFDVIPAIALVVLYRRGDGGVAAAVPIPRRRSPASPRVGPAPALMRRVAIALVLAGVLAPYASDTLGIVGSLAHVTGARAAGPYTFTVNSLGDAADVNPGDGTCATAGSVCTLRAAAQEASALYTADSTSVSTITFSVDGTIAVSTAINLAANATVDATNHRVVVDGGSNTAVMGTGGDSTQIHLKNFTIANGSAANGAGLFWGSQGDMTGMTFLNNAASVAGGAIDVFGSLTVTNSTFVGDSTPSAGGGADVLNNGFVSLTNVTIWQSNGGSLANPGGGGSVVNDSLIFGAQGFSCDTSFSGTNNIADDAGCTGTTNLTNTCAGNPPGCGTPPWIGTIGDHGGWTDTVNITPDSSDIALAAGSACISTDQRGVARGASSCDIGAYQVDPTTTISLSVVTNPSTPGAPADLLATVGTGAEPGPATGTVTFYQDGTSIGTASLGTPAPDEATLNSANLSAGSYTFTASYAGANGWTSSPTSAPVTDNVGQQTSTLAVTSNDNPAHSGDSVTLTATLSAANVGTDATGTVTFFDGGTSMGTAPLSAGTTASLTTAALTAGPHTITATYAGDTNYSGSTSPDFSQDVRVTSTTSVGTSLSPTTYGNAVTFTATVPKQGVLPQPSGTMTFTLGSNSYVQGVTNGVSQFTISTIDAGTQPVYATYNGDNYYTASTSSTINQVVNQATTGTTLGTSVSTAAYGAGVTLTAIVSGIGTSATPTGTVAFYDGATQLGTATLDGSGEASLIVPSGLINPLSVGGHSLTAAYVATTDFGASTSTAKSVTVTSATTTSTIQLSGATTVYGEPLTLTATVTPLAAGTPTGTVTFFDGATSLGSATLSGGSGAITLRPSSADALPVGAHSLTVVYAGDGSFTGSTSSASGETVTAASTAVVVGVPGASSPFGTSITLTATVTTQAPSTATPNAGTVTFHDGATVIGSASVASNGVASLILATLGAGSHSISATYAGTTSFGASSAGAAGYTVTQASTTISASPNAGTVVYDHGVNVTVTESSASATTGFTGTVQFLVDGSNLGSSVAMPANGVLTTTIYVPVGTHNVSAVYSGNGDITGSTSTAFSETVTAANTSTVVTSDGSPQLVFNTVTFTATISAGVNTETGTITFVDGSTSLGSSPVSNGVATFSTATLPPGIHTIHATYNGDSNFNASSGTMSQDIAGSSTTTAVAPSVNPSGYGESVTFTATVTPAASGSPMTGNVTFYDGLTSLGAVAINGSGQASVSTSALTIGSHSIKAVYAGDTNYLGSTASVVTQTVSVNTVTLGVTPSPNIQTTGNSVTLTATASTNFGTTVAGNVTFSVNGTAVATVSLSGNTAAYSSSTLPRGSDTIDVAYAGATGYTSATGTTTVAMLGQTPFVRVSPRAAFTNAFTPVPMDVSVTPFVGSTPVATGTVVVSDGQGNQCTVNIPAQANCSLTWPTPGTYFVTASYSGDTYWAPATSTSVGLVVQQATTSTRITSVVSSNSSGNWVSGDPVTVSWAVTAHSGAAGTVEVFAPGLVCTSTQLTGSCQVTFAGGGLTTIQVSYFGDTADASSFDTLQGTVYQCFAPFSVTILPATEGTVSLSPGFNCNAGTGYIDGTDVRATAHPVANYQVQEWGDNTTGATDDFQASSTQRGLLLIFQPICVHLHLFPYEYQNTGAGYSNTGTTSVSPAPGCGPGDNITRAQGTDSIGPYLSYQQGTPVTITANPFYNSFGYQNEVLGWYQDAMPGHTISETVAMTGDKSVYVDIGLHCYTFNVGSAEGGSVGLSPAPNCTDFNGHAGYTLGTQVTVNAHPGTGYWFSHLTYTGAVAHTVALGATVIPTSPPTSATFAVGQNINLNYYFQHIICFKLTISVMTVDGYTLPSSSVTGYGTGDCPALGAGYYAGGDGVGFATPLYLDGYQFLDWTGGATGLPSVPYWGSVVMDRDRTIVAQYYQTYACHNVTFQINPAGAGTVTIDSPTGHAVGCPDGQVLRGQGIAFTAHPTAKGGNETIGFSGGDVGPALIGATNSVYASYSDSINAWFCQGLNSEVHMHSPSGPVDTMFASGEQVVVLPGGNCPWGWTVGSNVQVVALGQDAGHNFTGWTGDVSGSDVVQPLTLTPFHTPTVFAEYDVICFNLTVNNGIGYDESPHPNCPHAPSGSTTFVGGTTVLLHGYSDSDYNYYGWTGDVVTADKDPAIVLMDGDKTAYGDYSKKPWTQKASEFFTSVGDDIAIAGKKAVGFASAFVGGYVLSKGPMGLLTGVDFLTQGLDSVLHGMGVDSNIGGAMGSVLDVAQQTMTFVNSYFACTATWALGNSTAAADAATAGSVYAKYAKLQDLKKQAAEIEAANKTGIALNQLRQEAAQASLAKTAEGFALSDFSSPSWDSGSASQAWTTGGDQIQSCIEDAVPSYLGLPPPPSSGG